MSTSHQQQAPGCSCTSAMLLLLFESTRKQLTQAAATQAKWLPPFPILCSPFPFSLSLSTTADTPHCSPSLLSLKDTRQGQLGTNLRLLIKAKQCRTQCEAPSFFCYSSFFQGQALSVCPRAGKYAELNRICNILLPAPIASTTYAAASFLLPAIPKVISQ